VSGVVSAVENSRRLLVLYFPSFSKIYFRKLANDVKVFGW